MAGKYSPDMPERMAAKRAAVAKKKMKKDTFGASGGWEGMTGMSVAGKIAEMRKAGVDEGTIKDMLKSGKKK
jgi:hypothetical protein